MWRSHLNVWKFLKQKELFPKALNWVQHWVSRIGLCNQKRRTLRSGEKSFLILLMTSWFTIKCKQGCRSSKQKQKNFESQSVGTCDCLPLLLTTPSISFWFSLRGTQREILRKIAKHSKKSLKKAFWSHFKHFWRLLEKIYLFLAPSKTDGRVPSQQSAHTTCNQTYWEVSQQTYYVQTLLAILFVVIGQNSAPSVVVACVCRGGGPGGANLVPKAFPLKNEPIF